MQYGRQNVAKSAKLPRKKITKQQSNHGRYENALYEKWNIAMLFSSLPNSYSNLITALESRREEQLTIMYVESKRRKTDNNDTHKAMMTVKTQNKSGGIVCYFCHKRGHFKKNCTRYIVWKKKQQHVNTTANNKFCLSAVNSDYCFVATDGYGKWIIDSGASCHICNDEKVFVNLNRSVRKPIVLANNNTVISNGEGMIKISLKANDQKYNKHNF